mgnify:FL=1
MEIDNTIILTKSCEIIMNEGFSALTIHRLAIESGLSEDLLSKQFENDEDILQLILIDFESQIKEFVQQFANNNEPPEIELKLLFKRLYFLFLQKPSYLAIINNISLHDRNASIRKSLSRIRTIAENHLSSIIKKGKMKNTFKTTVPNKTLVKKILSGFKLFMKDEQLLNNMVLELKSLKTLNTN